MEIKQSAGGVVIRRQDKKILVVSQHGDSWSLPKGHIEKGETAEKAARREIAEETGVTDLRLERKLGEYQRYRIGAGGKGEDQAELKNIVMFLFATGQKYLWPTDKENPRALWLNKGQVAGLLTHPKDKEFFLNIINQI